MGAGRGAGPFVLIGGGEWGGACRELDAELLAVTGATEVVVLPTAAAYEHPDRVGVRAREWFAEAGVPQAGVPGVGGPGVGGPEVGVKVRMLDVLHRAEAEDPVIAETVRKARYVHVADGSPLHLRSVLKDSAVFGAMLSAWSGGAALVASGAGATLLCDPMVDPRGGAYTVGLGVVRNLAVFPYHGTTAGHLLQRSIELLPHTAVLAGVDEDTALVLEAGAWRVAGAGAVTVYSGGGAVVYRAGDVPAGLPA